MEFDKWVVFVGDSDEPHECEFDDELIFFAMNALMEGKSVEIFGVLR